MRHANGVAHIHADGDTDSDANGVAHSVVHCDGNALSDAYVRTSRRTDNNALRLE
jgi:hypothetical protein